MTRANYLQTDFSGGVWSRHMEGRLDDPRYKTALRSCLNQMPEGTGALVTRSGWHYLWRTLLNTAARLIPFQTDDTTTYRVEMGAGYLAFFLGDTPLSINPVQILAVTGTSPAVFQTASAHGFSTNDNVVFSNLAGNFFLQNRRLLITVTGADTFTASDPATGTITAANVAGLTSATVAKIVRQTIAINSNELATVSVLNSGSDLLIFQAANRPTVLTNTAVSTFTYATISLLDGPYLDVNTTTTTLTPNATSGSVTITASAATGINDGDGFLQTDIGRLIRLKDDAGNWTWGTIVNQAGPTSITFQIAGAALANTHAITTWRLGAYSDTTGWPRVGIFHESRLWLLGPQAGRLDASVSGDFYNFAPTDVTGTVADDSAISFTIRGGENSILQWMQPTESGLLIGSLSGLWRVRASSLDDPITATSIQVRKVTSVGSAAILPAVCPTGFVYTQRQKRHLIEAVDDNRFRALSANERSLDLFNGNPVQQVVYQEDPVPRLWVRLQDGTLAAGSFTIDSEKPISDTIGWVPVVYGDTDATIEELAIMPSVDALTEELWMISLHGRTSPETNDYFIQRLEPQFTSEDIEDGIFLDAAVQITDPALMDASAALGTVTLRGLSHLRTDAISIMANGIYLGTFTGSADGVVTFDAPPGVIATVEDQTAVFVVGFPYSVSGETLRPEGGGQTGPSLNKMRRADRMSVLLSRVSNIAFGGIANQIYEAKLVSPRAPQGVAVDYSGVYDTEISGTSDWDGTVMWEQRRPGPAALLAMNTFFTMVDK